MNHPTRICVYCFGSSPAFVRESVYSIPWLSECELSFVIPTSHYEAFLLEEFPSSKILSLERSVLTAWRSREAPQTLAWSGLLSKISDSEKRPFGRRQFRELRLVLLRRELSLFLKALEPEALVFCQPVEEPAGFLATEVARELDIAVAIPCALRLMDRTFFANTVTESWPSFELDSPASGATRPADRNTTPSVAFLESDNHRGFEYRRSDALTKLHHGRVVKALRRTLSDPTFRHPVNLRVSLFSGLLRPLWSLIQGIRRRRSKLLFDIGSVDGLPDKFVFFPLQYTPESSINTQSPFFVDQRRVIDLLRYSLPDDHLLVLKEHPAAIGVRAPRWIGAARRLPGVRVARYDLPVEEIIKKASVTVTVTGTAALEALILGRPSLVLGPAFFADALGGQTSCEVLPEQIAGAIGRDIKQREVNQLVDELVKKSRPFSAVAVDIFPERMLSPTNITEFWEAFRIYYFRSVMSPS